MKKTKILSLLGVCILLNGCVLEDEKSETESSDNGATDTDTAQITSLYGLTPGDLPIGAALPAGDAENSVLKRDALQQIVSAHFSQITAENIMKPSYLQPSRGTFTYDDANALIDFAQGVGKTVHGHALVWHQQLPQWMEECSSDCEEIMKEHITAVAGEFAGKVVSWDVVNEAYNDDGTLRAGSTSDGINYSVWGDKIGSGYIQTAFETADLADSAAELYYNDYDLSDNGAKLDAVIAMANSFIAASVPIDGIGFQMHIESESPDIATIKAAFGKAVDTGLKVKISELDIQMNSDGSLTSFSDETALEQKARYEEVVAAYLESVPAAQRGGISVWGVSDADSWIPGVFGHADWPLLFDEDLTAKPAFEGFASALQAESGADDSADDSTTALFHDSFTDALYWYAAYSQGGVTTDTYFSHNADEGNMQISIPWTASGDLYQMGISFDNYDVSSIDITDGIKISFKIKLSTELAGKLEIYPVMNSVGGGTALFKADTDTGYVSLSGGDQWQTVTINGITPDFIETNGLYVSGWDQTQASAIGFQFKIAQAPSGSEGAIYVDDVKIQSVE